MSVKERTSAGADRDCCLCVCERGSGTEIEIEGVEIAKCRGASNCFHFSLMTTVPCGGTEPQIACQSRHTHTLRVILWTHTFAPVERIYFTSSSHGRLHSCVKPCLRLSGIFLFIQKRDVIALFAQQGPFLSLQKVLVGLTTLLSVPQHQNLQSKSQLCLLSVCHISIGSIVFNLM